MDKKENSSKALILTVNMGYGHQRTAYSLKDLAFEDKIININNYEGIPEKDKKIWETNRKFYEFISNFKKTPLIGNLFFSIFDQFQKILSFYPRRDLKKPNLTLKQIFFFLKRGWGENLIEKLKKNPLSLITTFFTPSFMAEFFNYPNDIYCVICDADISRTWVSLKPEQSKIKYFASTPRVVERLQLYGVKKENIFLTGYPLPKENIGSEKLEILKNDLSYRILNLDPKGNYRKQYFPIIKKYLGSLPEKSDHSLTIMFAIGGAGAQKDTGIKIIKGLHKKIKTGEIRIILAAGIREKVKDYLFEQIQFLGLENYLDKNIKIIWRKEIGDFFQEFNQELRKTDILWTKPSELSFYTALGLPIIMTPPIGSQEDFNRDWLLQLGSGMSQNNPKHANEWLFDILESGWFAEAAMQGFIEGEKLGTFNIEKIISNSNC